MWPSVGKPWHPSSLIKRRVSEALERLAFLLQESCPYLLSGGQSKACYCWYYCHASSLSGADEPTAMLDPRGRREVLDTVKKMNRREGITVVHITHFMEETLEADRILLWIEEDCPKAKPEELFNGETDLNQLGLKFRSAEADSHAPFEGLDIPANILNLNDLVNILC